MKGTERGEGDYYRYFRALFFRPAANTAFARVGVDGKLLSVSLVEEVGSLRPSLWFVSSGHQLDLCRLNYVTAPPGGGHMAGHRRGTLL